MPDETTLLSLCEINWAAYRAKHYRLRAKAAEYGKNGLESYIKMTSKSISNITVATTPIMRHQGGNVHP